MMRWLGAFLLAMGGSILTTRTPLVVRGSMNSSPSKPLLIALNVPMCAIAFLLLVSSPRPSRSRWRIDRPGTNDAAPALAGRSASGGRQSRDFLVPREEWALAQGKKVETTALRFRRSRLLP